MTRLATTASAVALCFGAVPALADLSPEQVWEEMSGLYEGTYQNVTFDEPTREGDTLVVKNFKLSFADDEVQASLGVAEMRLRAVDAGTVEITTSENFDVLITPEGDDAPEEFDFDISQSGMIVTATGEPNDIDWDYVADNITLAAMVKDSVEEIDMDINISMNDFAGEIDSNQRDELYSVTGNYDVGNALMTANVEAPDGNFEFQAELSSIAYVLDAALPLNMISQDEPPSMPELFEAGFFFELSSQTGGMQGTVNGVEPEQGTIAASFQSEGGDTQLVVRPEGLQASVDSEGFTANAELEALPAPFEVSLGSMGYDYALPLGSSAEPQDIVFGMRFIEFAMSDALWDLFDPNAHLDRSPASLDIALAAQAIIGEEIFASDVPDMEALDMQSFTLNRLLVSAIGARLTGEGAFEMQGEPNMAFGGLPTPVGKANFSLTGLNAALDALVAAQLVPEEQLFGIRMGLGMVAVSDGDDSYASEVEVTEDGAVLVNGNRMR